MVKNPPANSEDLRTMNSIQYSIYFNILAWRIPWTEEPGGLQSTGSQRVRHDWRNSTHTVFSGSCWVFINTLFLFSKLEPENIFNGVILCSSPMSHRNLLWSMWLLKFPEIFTICSVTTPSGFLHLTGGNQSLNFSPSGPDLY